MLAQTSGRDRLRLGRHALLSVPSAARRDLLREYLGRLVASTCQVEEAELRDAPLLALGIDTYAMINIRYSVETDLGVRLTLADLSQAASLTELAARLDELVSQFGQLFAGEAENAPTPANLAHFVRHYSWISGSRIPAPPKADIVTARGERQRSTTPSR